MLCNYILSNAIKRLALACVITITDTLFREAFFALTFSNEKEKGGGGGGGGERERERI